MPSRATPSKPRFLSRLFSALIILGGSLLTFLITARLSPSLHLPPTWRNTDGTPTPPGFLYAMFPATPNTPLHSSPGGPATSTLTRMVANSQQELDAGGWVPIRNPDATFWVRLDALTFDPPADPAYLQAYNAVRAQTAAKSPDAHRSATLTTTTDPNGDKLITFRRQDGNDLEQDIYRLTPKGPVPIEMSSAFGPAVALSNLPTLINCVLAAGAYFLVSARVVAFVRRRQRLAVAASTPTITQ